MPYDPRSDLHGHWDINPRRFPKNDWKMAVFVADLYRQGKPQEGRREFCLWSSNWPWPRHRQSVPCETRSIEGCHLCASLSHLKWIPFWIGGSNSKIEGILYVSIPEMLKSHHLPHINQLKGIDFLLMLGRIQESFSRKYQTPIEYWVATLKWFLVGLLLHTMIYECQFFSLALMTSQCMESFSILSIGSSYCLLESKKARVDM